MIVIFVVTLIIVVVVVVEIEVVMLCISSAPEPLLATATLGESLARGVIKPHSDCPRSGVLVGSQQCDRGERRHAAVLIH